MRWEKLRRSQNVEDRRRMGGGGIALGGGLGTMILLIILSMVFKVDLTQLAGSGAATQGGSVQTSKSSDRYHELITHVTGSTEEIWTAIFAEHGKTYRPAKLISYSGSTPMKVGGVANAATGPFYLPAEETVYLDVSFFDQMQSQFRAGGDFAYAYVVAHEMGHHVQHLLGYTTQVHSQRGKVPQKDYNQLSVRLELQADFLAGVWAHHADRQLQEQSGERLVTRSDVENALRAASAIGDDALQRQSRGQVVPDSFTHGTSEQRMRWFTKGFQTGDVTQGNTFALPYDEL